MRQDLGINSEYVFANPDSVRIPLFPMRSWDILSKYSVEANLDNPSAMTSTNFRKYTATVAQIMTLEENELVVVQSYGTQHKCSQAIL